MGIIYNELECTFGSVDEASFALTHMKGERDVNFSKLVERHAKVVKPRFIPSGESE